MHDAPSAEDLDALTDRYTAFRSFEEFCQLAMTNNYTPTLSRPELAGLAERVDLALGRDLGSLGAGERHKHRCEL